MTSKERVWATVRGKPVDRVPVFHWINAHAGARMMAEFRPSGRWWLNALSRFAWKRFHGGGELWRAAPLFYDVHSYNWANEYGMDLGSDILFMSHSTPWMWTKMRYEKGRVIFRDMYGVVRAVGHGIYPDVVDYPIKNIHDLGKYVLPSPSEDRRYDCVRDMRRRYPGASLAVETWGVTDFTGTSMFGFENFHMMLFDYPEEVGKFVRAFVDLQLAFARRSVNAGADIVAILDDYGYNNATMMSMKSWREFVFPELKRMVAEVHEMGALAMLHSCGYQVPLLDSYVEAEIDMLQAFQPFAGNDFKAAHEKYGKELIFVTGIDIQSGERWSPEELRKDIISNYKIGGRNGGHVLGTTHELQYTMPLENVKALFKTVGEIQQGMHD
jgi:uroporphyrinogen decarboxylase